jgi:hypothetical protein
MLWRANVSLAAKINKERTDEEREANKRGALKYSLYSFYLLIDQMCLPREVAFMIAWNRTFNKKGGYGLSLPNDQRLEHINGSTKSIDFGSMKDDYWACQRATHAQDTVEQVVKVLDRELSVPGSSNTKAHNFSVDMDEVDMIVHEFAKESHAVWESSPMRENTLISFPNFVRDEFSSIDQDATIEDMLRQLNTKRVRQKIGNLPVDVPDVQYEA